MMKLSERITDFRCDRLSEWGMDDLAFDAKKLEQENERLKTALSDAIRRPLGVVPDSASEFYDDKLGKVRK